jgi:antitoxin PrlF
MAIRLARRARIRGDRNQITLPPEIRDALHVRSGDELEFVVDEDGTVTVRGYVSIPADQAWFYTAGWQAGEREAREQLARGEGEYFDNEEDFLAAFEAR